MDVVYALWVRNFKRYIRSKSRMIGSLGMPLFFLVIIGSGLNSVISMPGLGENYVQFMMPGVVAMTVLFAAMFAGIQIIWDRQFGFLKETLVAPVSRLEIMLGQTLGGATTSLVQGLIILIIGVLFVGSSVSVAGFLLALVFMFLIGVSFTALGISFATRMEDMHAFPIVMNFVVFPLFLLSGAMFPLSRLPGWLKVITFLDPMTYGVEGLRYGLLGVSQIPPLAAFGVLFAFAAALLIIGGWLFQTMRI